MFIAYMIIRNKLREEYIIFWVSCTIVLVVFSFWRDGLAVMANIMGVYEAPNLVFIGAIFAILIYLLHLSLVVSKLQNQNKELAQEIALMKANTNKVKNENPNSHDPKTQE